MYEVLTILPRSDRPVKANNFPGTRLVQISWMATYYGHLGRHHEALLECPEWNSAQIEGYEPIVRTPNPIWYSYILMTVNLWEMN